MEKGLTACKLRAALQYDMDTGAFIWRSTVSSRAPAGSEAGRINHHGYRVIGLSGRKYMAHRLVWLYLNGKWPEGEIDHRNGDRADNRLGNLRDCTRRINAQNLHRPRADSVVGLLGVSKRRHRFRASITDRGQHIHIGYFATADEAYQTYLARKSSLHEGSEI